MNENLLMISGDRSLAEGKRGAFYHTLEEFSKHWNRIDVITPRAGHRRISVLFGNVHVHPSPWPIWLQPWWILKKGKKVFRAEKFSVMTVHEYAPFYNGIGARMLWRAIRVPYVLEIHHIPGYPLAAGFKEWMYCRLTGMFIAFDAKAAAKVRTVNKKQAAEFLVAAGVPAAKIAYVPSIYIDFSKIPTEPVQPNVDLLAVGRLVPNKNFASLIDTVGLLKKDFPDIILRIVGDGPLRSNLEHQVRERGLSSNVSFAGWLSDSELVAAYREAKIFVNPSLNEGGPRVAVEAMACGTPVVTTRVGLMPDIVEDGASGLFCDWSPESMAEQITRLLRSEPLRQSIGSAGRQAVMHFERRATIADYANFLKSIR